jgi:hypothetical protein
VSTPFLSALNTTHARTYLHVRLQVRQDYASVADFIKISVLDSASKLNAGADKPQAAQAL